MAIELTTATTAQLSGIRQSLGFPQITDIFPNCRLALTGNGVTIANAGGKNFTGNTINFKNCQQIKLILQSGSNQNAQDKITTLLNVQYLTNLENAGTNSAVVLDNNSLSESTLNQFFTDLPVTTKTATINVANNPGAATCDTSIATNKGYTVVTS